MEPPSLASRRLKDSIRRQVRPPQQEHQSPPHPPAECICIGQDSTEIPLRLTTL